MARVVLELVGKVYPHGVEAVRDVCLHVADGELVVLVGPSGCGKTTTLRMIAGLEPVTRGTIAIGGRVVNHVPPKERDVAMVFQNHVLYPHMSAYGNMAFGLRLRRLPKGEIDHRVRRAAAMLGIEPLLERKPRQLSGGERQRVAVGRAIVRQPACFLFDEPLSNLDARLRVQMRTELRQLHRELRTTTIYVTHDQEEALSLGDRVVVVRDGRIQQTGTPQELYRHPRNRFVAGFLGAAPMNFLDGTVVEHEGRLWFDEGAQRLVVPEWAVDGLRGRVGASVVLGVRPELLRCRPVEAEAHNWLDVTVTGLESLGDSTDVHLQLGDCPDSRAGGCPDFRAAKMGLSPSQVGSLPVGRSLVARLDIRSVRDAAGLKRVYVDLDRVHFFAPEGEGNNLCLAGEK